MELGQGGEVRAGRTTCRAKSSFLALRVGIHVGLIFLAEEVEFQRLERGQAAIRGCLWRNSSWASMTQVPLHLQGMTGQRGLRLLGKSCGRAEAKQRGIYGSAREIK